MNFYGFYEPPCYTIPWNFPIADELFRYWAMKRDLPWNNEPEPFCHEDLRNKLHREFNRR